MLIRPRPHRWKYATLLRPFAQAYAGVTMLRNRHYDRTGGHAAAAPVMSVGNITAGGTGKTPLVIALVRQMQSHGRKPAILTRGYKAKPGQTADEVLEFQRAVPDVPVVVNPDRVAGAQTACSTHAADVLVMDDGFQHRRLARDLDIVVIDALRPWGGGRLLPEGRLREGLRGLRRGHVFVISRANQVSTDDLAAIESQLHRYVPAAPIAYADVDVRGVWRQLGSTPERVDALADLRLQPVCAIGNPETFVRSLESLGSVVRYPIAFRDHYRYVAADVHAMLEIAAMRGCDAIVTTGKDWGKLHPLWPSDAPLPLLRLEIAMALRDPDGVLERSVAQAIGAEP